MTNFRSKTDNYALFAQLYKRVAIGKAEHCTYDVVDVFPVVQRNQLKRSQHRPKEIVEIRVTMVGVGPDADAYITDRTMPVDNHNEDTNQLTSLLTMDTLFNYHVISQNAIIWRDKIILVSYLFRSRLRKRYF